jgi:hypothetical protein
MFLVLKSQKIANYFPAVFGVKNDSSVSRPPPAGLLSYCQVMTAYFQPPGFQAVLPIVRHCKADRPENPTPAPAQFLQPAKRPLAATAAEMFV